jgi:phosphoribosylglycinamide formyltransferase 1
MTAPMQLGFLASHGGSSMRAILAAIDDGRLAAQARILITNNAGSAAAEHAKARGLKALHISARTEGSPQDEDAAIAAALKGEGVTHVLLSGYLRKLGPATLAAFPGRILNIHPARLPSYGGQGMYGDFVHAAVLNAGEAVTGATVHVVDEEYDHGPTLAQCEVPVLPGDTVESLRARVMAAEPLLFIETLQAIEARGGRVLP